jgi:hypothetical protein
MSPESPRSTQEVLTSIPPNFSLAERLASLKKMRRNLTRAGLAMALLLNIGCRHDPAKKQNYVPEPPPAVGQPTPKPTEILVATPTLTPTSPIPKVITPESTPTPSPTTTSLEHGRDLLGKEELANLHIKIYDLPNQPDYVKLSFTRDVLNVEPAIRSFAGGQDQLSIYLIDNSFIHPNFLTEEQRKSDPHVVSILRAFVNEKTEWSKKEIEKQRPQRVSDYNRELQALGQRLESKTISNDRFNVEKRALDYKFRSYVGQPTMEDLLGPFAGFYYSRDDYSPFRNSRQGYIFMPVRNSKLETFKSGSEEITVQRFNNRQPKPEQSYPSPEDLQFDETARVYPIRRLRPGIILGHEIAHAFLNLDHPAPDFYTRNRLTKAFYDDVRHYWIVFDVPEGPVISSNPIPLAS